MAHKLKHKLAERILNDEGLTDELDDDDASTLINWGIAQVEALADRAAVSFSPEAEAPDDIEAQAEQIRRIMKHINRLVGMRTFLPAEEIEAQLGRLREMAAGLRKVEPDALDAKAVADPQRSSQEVIARLLRGVSLQPPDDLS